MHEHAGHHSHGVTPEALLSHMAEHNKSHLAELEHLADHLPDAAANQVQAACDLYRQGNELLASALLTLKENL